MPNIEKRKVDLLVIKFPRQYAVIFAAVKGTKYRWTIKCLTTLRSFSLQVPIARSKVSKVKSDISLILFISTREMQELLHELGSNLFLPTLFRSQGWHMRHRQGRTSLAVRASAELHSAAASAPEHLTSLMYSLADAAAAQPAVVQVHSCLLA